MISLLTSRWFITFLGVLALSLLVWFLGPLFAFAEYEPLASVGARLIAICLIFVTWLGLRLYSVWQERKANAAVADGISAESASETPDESEEELAILREHMQQALDTLKRSRLGGRFGRQQLYQLPWYIIIGPPGSGKTTALVNSGLRFPLAESLGEHAKKVGGVGGTRNCDWWFTDEAVLIDTAGRYTTQDSREEVDRAGWRGFLAMLKKHRRRRPINGALIMIGLADMLRESGAEREQQAAAVRRRVQELYGELGVRFPIYVVFTKSDLVAGFVEYFDDLGRSERAQVWGVTFPVDASADAALESFAEEFGALELRLQDRLVERMAQERDPRKRDAIYAFPQQFASLQSLAQEFLDNVFRTGRLEARPFLRGVYFTSGTQEGTPIDRLMGSFAQTFGLDQQKVAPAPGSGRSYFIERLFRDVVFQEAALTGTNLKLERQLAWLKVFSYVGTAAVVLLAIGLWTTSYWRNETLVDMIAERTAQASGLLTSASEQMHDPLALLPALDAASELAAAELRDGPGLLMSFGLYQGDKLAEPAKRAHGDVLKRLLLPHLLAHLEEQLARNRDPEYLYETLKVYLMLADPAHFDADSVRAWITLDWNRRLPRTVTAQQRTALQRHVDDLLAIPAATRPVSLDATLVDGTRRVLARLPTERRVYGRLKRAGAGNEISDFALIDGAGPDAPAVFVRKSGKPLSEGIPGLYTYDGYYKVFAKESVTLSTQLAEESWVLGKGQSLETDPESLMSLIKEVRQLYLRDYVKLWRELLADIAIVPITSLEQAIEVITVLVGPNSPIRNLLVTVERETRLDRREGALAQAAQAAGDRLQEMLEKLEQIMKPSEPAASDIPETDPGDYVEQQFKSLNRLVAGDPPTALDRTLSVLEELLVYLHALQGAQERGEGTPAALIQQGNKVIGQVSLAGRKSPSPLNGMLNGVATTSRDLMLGGIVAQIRAAWQDGGAVFCGQALRDRYPLNKVQQEVTLDDFGTFFAPEGLMDTFFKAHLKRFVDTSRIPWRWREQGGITQATLAQFRRAEIIKRSFFRGSDTTPSISFTLKPVSMAKSIRQFTLYIGEQQTSYRHGPQVAQAFTWPDPSGRHQVRIEIDPPQARAPSSIIEDGPWAWFRILDVSEVEPTSQPELFFITFNVGGKLVRYELRASSAFNPFGLKALQQFSCPSNL